MKQNVPFDLAFSLEDEYRRAFCIILGEMEGGTFNWGSMAFEEPGE